MSVESADEAKLRCIRVMGADLGETFHHLMQEAAFLHLKWNEYVQLFGHSEARILALNKAAPGFFWLVNDIWWDDLILHLFRFIDPNPKVLSVHRLERLLRPLPANFAALRDALVVTTEFARDRRHRHIAHRNADLVLKRNVKPLPGISRNHVRDTISALDAVLHCVDHHFTGREAPLYDHLETRGGSDALLWHLQRGLAARDEDYAAKRPPPRFAD